jgi:hypothetical protein
MNDTTDLYALVDDLELETLAEGTALASVSSGGTASTASCPATTASTASCFSSYT